MASRFECSFCLDRFVDPRFLPCPGHHTFCRGCIENYLIRTVQSTRPGTEFKCPNCRSMVKLPKDGIAGLTVNYYLDETKEKAPKPRYNTCKKHREEDLRFYCIKCKEVICRDCKVVSHEGHKIEMVADVIAKLKENIETFLDVATIDLNARERDLRVSVDSKIKDYQESLGSVEPAVKILKTELNGVFEAFTNSTKPGYEKAKENLNTIINWAAKSRQRISFYREKLNQECRQTSFETVKVLEEYRDSFQDIYEKNAPPKIDMFVRSSCFVESEVSKLSEKVLVAAKDFKRSMSNHFRRGARYGIPPHEQQTGTGAGFRGKDAAGTSHKMLQKLRPATIAAAKQRQMVTTKHLKDNIPTSVGTDADWPVLGRPVRVYKNVPWMPEHTVVPPSSQGSFPVSQQIIVGNLPSDTNEEDLRKFFERFGTTVGVRFEPEKDNAVLIYDNPATVKEIIRQKLKAYRVTDEDSKSETERPIKLDGHRLTIEKMDYDSEARHEGACLYTYTYNPLPDVNRDRRSSASPLHDFTLSSDDNGDSLSFFAEDSVDAYPSNMPSSNNDKTGGDQPSVDLTVSTEDNDGLSFFSEDFLM